MKKFYNYTFQLVCAYIIALTLFAIPNIELTVEHFTSSAHNENSEKTVDSILLAQDESIDEAEKEEESINEEEVIEEVITPEIVVEQEVVETVQQPVNIVDTSSFAVISNETVTISHYGHDCYGCTSGKTASGYYVGDGTIYYEDNTFGSVRIVAADNKYPLGSIIRLSYQGTSINAIVLDRGGGIGDGKRFQIDLLVKNENEASQNGVIRGANLEVLRLGY